MSVTVISSFPFYIKQVSIYVGIPTLIAGCIGGLLNIIVFLSLKTFRENSCGFYLTIMSLVNIGQLLIGLLYRIMINGFGIDWILISPFLCKLFQYSSQVCPLTSLTCLCLATIDQYLATCSRQRWQQWCTIKLAYCLSTIAIFIWLMHGIPYLIYFNIIQSSTTRKFRCRITNDKFSKYFTYFYTVVLTGYLPVFITILFGLLAYSNIRQLSYRTIPLVRRELDKQLTTMVLVLDVFNIIALMPYPLIFLLTSVTNIASDPIIASRIHFVTNLSFYFYNLYFASSFYIFVCVSERFRRQLVYVFFKIHLERWRRHRMVATLMLPR